VIYIQKIEVSTSAFLEMETPASMEPMLPEEGNRTLEDLATDLIAKANRLAVQLRPEVSNAVGDLVRSMNCYYSNLIEGHNTHPRDIDRALAAEFSTDPEKRILQLEARAHIDVQRRIDDREGGMTPSVASVRLIHEEFCKRLPEELLWVTDPETKQRVRVIPGALRDGGVVVGRHVPPRPSDLPAFLDRFGEAYRPESLSRIRQVVAVAASHHRLLWIHPFYDGNGRVARLFSHAFLKRVGVGSSLWSIARGLARRAADYKAMLMLADQPRRGDLDGRGSLSAKGLADFCEFFLECCIDQVEYMTTVLEPHDLIRRVEIYCEEETRAGRLPNGSFPLLREALLAGSFERGKAPAITGYQERQARTALAALQNKGLLTSQTPKGQVYPNFPAEIVERWFPKLYPAG
jgi:Fic family protein